MSHFSLLCIGDGWESNLMDYCEVYHQGDSSESIKFKFYPVIPEEKIQIRFEEWKKNSNNNTYNNALEWAEKYMGFVFQDGMYGYYYNPNAKWDWYAIGGRWRGYLKLKPGKVGFLSPPYSSNCNVPDGYCDQAKNGDIDWEGMKIDSYKSAEKDWEWLTSGSEEVDGAIKFAYDFSDTDTKESYIKRRSSIATYAILYNGKWSEMEDFYSSEAWDRYFNEIIESLPDDELITILDYHI